MNICNVRAFQSRHVNHSTYHCAAPVADHDGRQQERPKWSIVFHNPIMLIPILDLKFRAQPCQPRIKVSFACMRFQLINISKVSRRVEHPSLNTYIVAFTGAGDRITSRSSTLCSQCLLNYILVNEDSDHTRLLLNDFLHHLIVICGIVHINCIADALPTMKDESASSWSTRKTTTKEIRTYFGNRYLNE